METPDHSRYARQEAAVPADAQSRLGQACVAIIGCGGLGGYVAENLLRLGILRLRLMDPDVFSPSNLNRQRFATEENLGRYKAESAATALRQINSMAEIEFRNEAFVPGDPKARLQGVDLVMDCLDSVSARCQLADYCEAHNLPLVHAAIHAYFGQVAFIRPGSALMHKIYPKHELKLPPPCNLSFVAAATAAFQSREALFYLMGKETLDHSSLLTIDFESSEITRVPLP